MSFLWAGVKWISEVKLYSCHFHFVTKWKETNRNVSIPITCLQQKAHLIIKNGNNNNKKSVAESFICFLKKKNAIL